MVEVTDQRGKIWTYNWGSPEGGKRVAGIGGKERETQHLLYLALAFLLDSQVGELGFPGREPNSWKGGEADEDG